MANENHKFHPRTEEAYQLMHNGILALSRAEQAGIRVDMDYIEREKKRTIRRMEHLEQKFKETKFYRHWEHSVRGRVNINSRIQLGKFLYDVKKITPARYTPSGLGSTDEEALQGLNIPELNLLLRRTKLKKIYDVLEGFAQEQVEGYLHPVFNLHLVRTFRSSSNTPNMQNVPKRDEEMMKACRKALYPRPGHQFVEADFSGLEVRIAACYHQDPTMLQYINDPASDMHADMAKQIFCLDKFDRNRHYTLRQAAKNGFVFPQFYGDYYKNCANNMAVGWGRLSQGRWSEGQGIAVGDVSLADHMRKNGIRSYQAFERHVQEIERDFWTNRFPVYAEWKEKWWRDYKRKGYLDMYTGFRCHGIMNKNDCINYPVQGAAFHCLLWSFTEIDGLSRREGWKSRLVGQIHDSMLLDVHPSELRRVKKAVREVTCVQLPAVWNWIVVPLKIDVEVYPVDSPWIKSD